MNATPEPADSEESLSRDNQAADGRPSPDPEAPEALEIAGARPPCVRARIVGPAILTWLHYAVPLLLLSAIAFAPVIALALRVPVPVDQAGGKAVLALGWELVALGWLSQLVLVGAATAIVG